MSSTIDETRFPIAIGGTRMQTLNGDGDIVSVSWAEVDHDPAELMKQAFAASGLKATNITHAGCVGAGVPVNGALELDKYPNGSFRFKDFARNLFPNLQQCELANDSAGEHLGAAMLSHTLKTDVIPGSQDKPKSFWLARSGTGVGTSLGFGLQGSFLVKASEGGNAMLAPGTDVNDDAIGLGQDWVPFFRWAMRKLTVEGLPEEWTSLPEFVNEGLNKGRKSEVRAELFTASIGLQLLACYCGYEAKDKTPEAIEQFMRGNGDEPMRMRTIWASTIGAHMRALNQVVHVDQIMLGGIFAKWHDLFLQGPAFANAFHGAPERSHQALMKRTNVVLLSPEADARLGVEGCKAILNGGVTVIA